MPENRPLDAETMKLASLMKETFDAGYDRLCLLCKRGFNGDACPHEGCWPPSLERQAQNSGIIYGLTSVDVYAWVCMKLGATRPSDKAEALWLAVRDALDKAVRGGV
jgi:hypothetical protein